MKVNELHESVQVEMAKLLGDVIRNRIDLVDDEKRTEKAVQAADAIREAFQSLFND